MSFFKIALCLALAETSLAVSHDDLYKALDTNRRIWIVLRDYHRYTEGQEHSCIHAEKTLLTDTNYEFNQYYKVGNTRYLEHLYGTLQRENPVLTVSKTKGGPGIEYTLKYWNEEQHCAYLTFTDPGDRQSKCELHLWEENIPTSTELYPCEDQYEKFCGSNKHNVFKSSCLE
uniref:Lipocalin/cytosolic fatty-acid binding domain-containing protein n=1 Tax=Amblyomma maculatum TaxID=34609 RepID=G3MQ53_AMBMU